MSTSDKADAEAASLSENERVQNRETMEIDETTSKRLVILALVLA